LTANEFGLTNGEQAIRPPAFGRLNPFGGVIDRIHDRIGQALLTVSHSIEKGRVIDLKIDDQSPCSSTTWPPTWAA
jgi:hypothetical protein